MECEALFYGGGKTPAGESCSFGESNPGGVVAQTLKSA